ncbi:MAG TPA: hypothetical protein VFZ28_09570 [Burkholderiaceae bacterium]|nr:hypothetical protein [Burkholderiaceae bacterium]
MDQLTARDLVLVGLVTQSVLALLFGLVWRGLRGGWAAWLSLGFAANAASYGFMMAGSYRSGLYVEPARSVASAALTAVVLITIGVIDYVGVERRWARRLSWTAVAMAAASVSFGLLGLIDRAIGDGVMSAYVLGWVCCSCARCGASRTAGTVSSCWRCCCIRWRCSSSCPAGCRPSGCRPPRWCRSRCSAARC